MGGSDSVGDHVYRPLKVNGGAVCDSMITPGGLDVGNRL